MPVSAGSRLLRCAGVWMESISGDYQRDWLRIHRDGVLQQFG